MSTTVTVVIAWPWEPMDLPGSRSIPGKSQQWILLSQPVSEKTQQQWGDVNLWENQLGALYGCVLGLGSHSYGGGLYSVRKTWCLHSKYSSSRIHKCGMAFYNTCHSISFWPCSTFLIPISFRRLTEEVFQVECPKGWPAFGMLRIREQHYLGRCTAERPEKIKLSKVWEYWTFLLPFISKWTALNSNSERDKKILKELTVAASAWLSWHFRNFHMQEKHFQPSYQNVEFANICWEHPIIAVSSMWSLEYSLKSSQ